LSAVQKSGNGITLVTVTYGDRLKYLTELLDRAFGEERVFQAVVVNNAAISDVSAVKAKWGNRVVIVDLDRNTGSANGYAVGIRTALNLDAEYIWLMDDDNAPAKGTVNILRHELGRLSKEVGIEWAAVVGFRKSRMTALPDLRRNFAPRSNFVGFHVVQVPRKFLKLIGRSSVDHDVNLQMIDVPYSPYGVFLAHREAFERLGVPKSDFVLYADDWEYTMRLTKNGGKIRLVPNAAIDDLEASWTHSRKRSNVFFQSLVFGSDFQVYYTFRNHVWLNRNLQCASVFVYYLNKFVFLFLLSAFALALRKRQRFDVIRRAIFDGEQGSLGVNPNFPLPSQRGGSVLDIHLVRSQPQSV